MGKQNSPENFPTILAKSPSDSMLTKCFLATFLKEEQTYLSEIASTNIGDTISFDQTFEVAGYLREDGKWIPLYDKSFYCFKQRWKNCDLAAYKGNINITGRTSAQRFT